MELRRLFTAASVLNQGKAGKSNFKSPRGGNLLGFFYHPRVEDTELDPGRGKSRFFAPYDRHR
jgi:hypothetical protein